MVALHSRRQDRGLVVALWVLTLPVIVLGAASVNPILIFWGALGGLGAVFITRIHIRDTRRRTRPDAIDSRASDARPGAEPSARGLVATQGTPRIAETDPTITPSPPTAVTSTQAIAARVARDPAGDPWGKRYRERRAGFHADPKDQASRDDPREKPIRGGSDIDDADKVEEESSR